MSLRRVGSLAIAAGIAGSMTACGTGGQSISVPPSTPGGSLPAPPNGATKALAATGHSEAEVLQQIADARVSGQTIRYVVVRTRKRDYTFPVMAQIVRTDSELVVRAYKKMYAWPLGAVKIYYSGASSAYDMTRIPLVHASDLDARAVAARHTHLSSGTSTTDCFDCDLLLYRPARPSFPDAWANVKDPWQVDRDFDFGSAPSGTTRQPRFVNYGSGCDAGWTCYYGGYGGYTGGDPGSQGGGGGPAPASGTGLQGNPCQVGPVSNAATQKAALIKAAGNAYAALGANNAIFNNTPANTNAQEYYGFIYTNGPSYMYDGPYALTLDGAETGGPSNPFNYDGWSPVGIWHTHPGYTGTGTPDGVENGSHFSAADLNYMNTTGFEMFVGEHNSLGSGDTIGATRWYSRDPGSKSDSSAQAVGSGGC
jgi:hypothetical protein